MSLYELETQSGGTVKQKKYLKKNPLRRYFIRQYLNSVQELSSLVSARNLLDVGCGEGFVIQHLQSNFPNLELTGIDIDLDVLKVATYQNPDSSFATALADKLPVASTSYDLVLCNEVLEHLEKPEDALQEINRVGSQHFIFSVPHEPHYRLANMAAGANWSRWGDDIDHCQRWTRSQFIRFINNYFRVIQVRTPFPWIMVLCQKR